MVALHFSSLKNIVPISLYTIIASHPAKPALQPSKWKPCCHGKNAFVKQYQW